MIPQLVDRRSGVRVQDLVVELQGVYERLVEPLGLEDWVFDLVLVADEAMEGLNGQFRGKDGRTDVLSFSYLLDEAPGQCSLAQGMGSAAKDLWVDRLAQPDSSGPGALIGEVILAPDFVTQRCKEKGWPPENEFPLLVVHGALHLLGWDHKGDLETEMMRKLEEDRLSVCGLSHPLRTEEGFI